MSEVYRFIMVINDKSTPAGTFDSLYRANTIGEVADFIQTWLHFDNEEMLDVMPFLERTEHKNKLFFVESVRNQDLRVHVMPFAEARWMFMNRLKWILN